MSFTLGPLVISLDRLLFILAFFAALLVGWWVGRRRGVTVEPVLTRMLIFGLIGARLGFVALYWEEYWAKPWSIIDIRDGGFLLSAGLATAAATGAFYVWRNNLIKVPLAAGVTAGLVLWVAGVGLGSLTPTAQMSVPHLVLPNLQGEFQSLRELHAGRPMVVNVWATWCPPCRREMPVLAQAQQNEKDVAIVLINQGEHSDVVLRYLEKERLEFDNMLLDPQSRTHSEMGVRALPSTFFFNAEGELVDSHFGELSAATLRHALRRL